MSTLQSLLNRGLVDIGSDDSRFEKMQLASSALATRFNESPNLLIPATLISLDDGVDEQEPMFAMVEDLLISQWKTLRNTHVNRPRELLRSIIIDALATTTAGNTDAAGIVWNTAASPMRHGQGHLGKASEIIEKLLRDAGDKAENEAVARAELSPPLSSNNTTETSAPDVSLNIGGTINDEELLTAVLHSIGPQDGTATNAESRNPHWPNTGQPWAQEFAPRMAAVLAMAVNLATSRLATSLNEQMSKSLGDTQNALREVTRTNESGRMRLDVLWWSEALYSPSLRIGYRESSMPVAAVAAAVDLAALVPPLAPASVCYILGETVWRIARDLPAASIAEQTISNYLSALADARTSFGDRFPNSPASGGRRPLLDLVVEASRGDNVSSDLLRSCTGVDGDLAISAAEFAMWVFRDLQARRVVEQFR